VFSVLLNLKRFIYLFIYFSIIRTEVITICVHTICEPRLNGLRIIKYRTRRIINYVLWRSLGSRNKKYWYYNIFIRMILRENIMIDFTLILRCIFIKEWYFRLNTKYWKIVYLWNWNLVDMYHINRKYPLLSG
jgi:hypothetical protein